MKLKNKTFLLFICLIFIISAGAASATDNFDNQTLDDSNGEILNDKQTKSIDDLQTLVNQKNESGELVITDNYWPGEPDYTNELLIDKSISISGTGENYISSKINVTSGEVVIKNLVLDNCKIYATNSKLTLQNCHINGMGYKSESQIRGDTIEIINTTFLNMGHPIGDSKNVIIINSTFNDDNRLFYHFSNITSLKIFNCEFKNLCELYLNANEAEVSNSTFSKNSGMVLNFKNANITNCRFIENLATDNYSDNIVRLKGNTTLHGNTFLNNSYVRAVRFVPEENTVANFYMTNNIFISQYGEGEYSTCDTYRFTPLTLSTTYIKPATKTIHVPASEDFDDYFYDITLSKVFISHNFFGFNIEDADEFRYNKIIIMPYERVKANLVNLYLQKNNNEYTLSFVDDDANIISMPESVFSIIDKKSGEAIISNISVINGKATFNCDREISVDDVYIVNCLNQIVNKPKANMTIIKTGTDYLDTKVEVILNNETEPIGNESIHIFCIGFEDNGHNLTNNYNIVTRSDGTQIVAGKTDVRLYYGSFLSAWGTVTEYRFKILFSNKEFGTTVQTINFKIDKVDSVLTLKSTTKTYNPNAVKLTSISQLSPVTWTSPKYGEIKDEQLYYKIYKKNKEVLYATIYFYDEIKLYDEILPALDVGTYKIIVQSDEFSVYKVPTKTATLKIKPAKTTTKAPKVSHKYKKSKYFKVSVKLNKKAVKKIKINLKIYTGKKSKNYIVKTDSKGIAKFNTKNLKIGKHKVVITSKNGNYIINAKSQITIKR